MEIVRITREHLFRLLDFMLSVQAHEPSRINFHPHGRFASALEIPVAMARVMEEKILGSQDPYFLGLKDDIAIAYGFLRGWEEGFLHGTLGVAVRPGFQRRGYGREMLLHLLQQAREHGDQKVRLTTYRTNPIAEKLRAFGFQLGDCPGYPERYEGRLSLK